MRTWQLQGVAGGNWVDPANITQPFTSAASGRSVFQTVNNTSGTMFLVSNDTNVINRAVWGTLRIESRHTDSHGACSPTCASNEADDDWLGFVMGYRNVTGDPAFPEQYVGFTWNRGGFSPYGLPGGGTNAQGIFLVKASPPAANGDPVGAGSSVVDSETGPTTGWRYDTDYQFRILYTTDRIRVYINDVLRLEATAAQAGVSSFSAGQFGFTNASQANVLFGNVREAAASTIDSAPIASDDKFYYGLTWGAAYDNTNVFDTDTDPVAEGILDNDYDPDGDLFVLKVNGVSLPADADSTTFTGSQGGTFEVWGSGRVRYTAPTDYQTRGPFQDSFSYTIVDEDGERSATVTLTVQETNTDPDNITLTDIDTGSTADIRVNQWSAAGTVVGTIVTVENSVGELDEYDYELTNASNGAFAIVGDQLTVRDTTALGGPQTHTIVIRSTDVEGQTVSRTFSVHVDPNALPTSGNASVNAAAAVPYAFPLAKFPFEDTDGDELQKLLVTSLPAHGTLFVDLDGDNVADDNEVMQLSFNDVVTRAQIIGGRLKYLSASATDTGTTFAFKVSDGTAYSASSSTMTVNVEADSDNDGIPNTVEGKTDRDGDGQPNYNDTDSDGDGIPDSTESTADTDGDGTPDYLDSDSDNDGLPDSSEGGGDLDQDGIPDYRDMDRDGDGIPDSTEAAEGTNPSDVGDYRDTDHDGVPDYTEGTHGTNPNDPGSYRDTDHDGVPDYVETLEGTNPNSGTDFADSDGDGFPDYTDQDSDNDGVSDEDEGTADTDGDGVPDYLDRDSDNDGIPDTFEFGFDTDGDGIPDVRDLDSDGDGVSDRAESGATGVDSDHDGIDDAFDPDATGGTDANHDRVADGAGPLDTDGDGVPDFRDLDSDNDSIPDVIEGGGADENGDGLLDQGGTVTSTPTDTDGDGRPDLRDLDSDGDGVPDIRRTRFAVLDADNDGRIDVFGDDVDGDGVADAIDGEPDQRGTRVDNDEDGVPANRDMDDDGDGIPDSLEGTADTDGDGTIDRLDRDSDNDGIPDRIEMGLGRPSGVDSNGNGIDDLYENVSTRRDSDNDGIPDYLDDDSDNDGMPDVLEILRVRLLGADSDGDGIDDAIDVDVTHGFDANGDGVDDAMLNLVDTDGDGLEDYRDPDSDNDGIPDGKENGDFNNDGINDRLQKDPGLKTGLKGGGGSFGWFGVLGLFALSFVRRLRRKAAPWAPAALVGVVVLSAPATQARADEGHGWNFGVSAISTDLRPDDSRSVWRVVDDSDHGFKVSAQYRFRSRFFLELGYADMGSAVVVNRNPAITGSEPVDYSAPSLLAGYLLFDPQARFNAHVKAGYAALLTDAADSVINKQQHSNQLALGAGVSVRLWQRLSAEVEYEYYDEDAKQVGFGLRYSF